MTVHELRSLSYLISLEDLNNESQAKLSWECCMSSSYKAHSWKDNDAIECNNTAYKNRRSMDTAELFVPFL